MKQDPSRRPPISPRSGSLLDLASHRRHPSPSLLQSPATAARLGFSSSLGSCSVSGYTPGSPSYQMLSLPMAPTTGGGAWAGVVGNSTRQVSSFFQTSQGVSFGSSFCYRLPPSPLGPTSGGGLPRSNAGKGGKGAGHRDLAHRRWAQMVAR